LRICCEFGIIDSSMSEKEQDNLPAKDCEQIDESDNDFIPADARPLCLKCLTICHPLQFYCHNCDCDDAINPLTPYIGFVNIRFNIGMLGKLGRRVLYDKEVSTIWRVIFLLLFIFGVLLLLGRC